MKEKKQRNNVLSLMNMQKEEKMKNMAKTSTAVRGGATLAGVPALVLLIAALLILQPFSVEARRFGPQKSPDEIVQTLTDRLELTAEQEETVRPIIEEKIRKMGEIRQTFGTDRVAARAEMQKLRWDTEQKLGAVLTDEQVEKYLALRQDQRGTQRQGRRGGGWMNRGSNGDPGLVMERLSSRLDLTEEQAVAIEPVIRESMDRRRAVFEHYQGQGWAARDDMRSEMRSIGNETHADISTVLTAEQVEELNAMRDERRARMRKQRDCQGPMGF